MLQQEHARLQCRQCWLQKILPSGENTKQPHQIPGTQLFRVDGAQCPVQQIQITGKVNALVRTFGSCFPRFRWLQHLQLLPAWCTGHGGRQSIWISDKRMMQQIRPSEPLLWILLQQALQEGPEGFRHGFWIPHRLLDNQPDQRHERVRVEWRLPDKELVANYAQRPQVNTSIIRPFLHQFWCHVQRSPLYGGENGGIRGHGPSKSEVAKLHGAIGPDEDILWLHVAMNHFL
mmetsp:Transcript_36666/g.86047  ORF Transcript_36666/g.86047 Transcript_36666/m.86047 type:complete len:232 (-) Transcript_36666:458-1153(-)